MCRLLGNCRSGKIFVYLYILDGSITDSSIIVGKVIFARKFRRSPIVHSDNFSVSSKFSFALYILFFEKTEDSQNLRAKSTRKI